MERSRRPHGLRTQKISISVSKDDLRLMTERARRVHRGNLSAVVHEMAETLRRKEALVALLDDFGGEPSTAAELQALRDEIAHAPTGKPRRPAA